MKRHGNKKWFIHQNRQARHVNEKHYKDYQLKSLNRVHNRTPNKSYGKTAKVNTVLPAKAPRNQFKQKNIYIYKKRWHVTEIKTSLIQCHSKMTEHWTKYRVIKNDTEGVEELSSKPDWVLRFKHCVVRFVWVLSSKSEAYLQLHYIRIKVEPNA